MINMQPKPMDFKEETIKNAREFKMHEIKQNDARGVQSVIRRGAETKQRWSWAQG